MAKSATLSNEPETASLQDASTNFQMRQSARNVSVPDVFVTVEDDNANDNHDFPLLEQGSRSRVCCVPQLTSADGVPRSPSSTRDARGQDSDTSTSWKPRLSEFSSKKICFGDGSQQFSKKVRRYYEAQNKLIREYESLQENGVSEEENLLQEKRVNRVTLRLSQISFAANLILLVGKAVGVALSGSISILSSLVDSAVDLLSGLVVWYTSRAVRHPNPYIYPSGKRRLEPLAIVVLSVIMSLASFQLIIQSIQKIVAFTSDKDGGPHFEVHTILIIAFTIVTKGGLFLMCVCAERKHSELSSSVEVLKQDHRNDILSNSVALVCGYLGSQQFAALTGQEDVIFIDPLGAILIGAYILLSWWNTGLEQIQMLTGLSAKPDFLSKVTWVCLNHSPLITHIDTVRAFHSGPRFLVEVDIVLPKDMTLTLTHEVGESLQQKLESLREVERAFVHVDWESRHRPEVEHKTS